MFYKKKSYILLFCITIFMFSGCLLQIGDLFPNSDKNSSIENGEGGLSVDKFAFSDDLDFAIGNNNEDGKINPGETIRLDVGIYNSGKSEFYGVKTVVSTDSRYVIFKSKSDGSKYDHYNHNNILSGYYSTARTKRESSSLFMYPNEYPYVFSISKDTPYGINLPFSITITDSKGYSHTDSFNLKVERRDGNISVDKIVFSDKSSFSYENNNGDGKINPGETIRFDFGIHNSGTSTLQDVKSVVSTSSPYVKFLLGSDERNPRDNYYYGSISGGCYSTSYSKDNDKDLGFIFNPEPGYYPYVISISKDIPSETVIRFLVTTTDSLGSTWTDNLILKSSK